MQYIFYIQLHMYYTGLYIQIFFLSSLSINRIQGHLLNVSTIYTKNTYNSQKHNDNCDIRYVIMNEKYLESADFQAKQAQEKNNCWDLLTSPGGAPHRCCR